MNGGKMMSAVMGNLAAAVELIKNFFNMIKEFFASLFESVTIG